MIFFNDTDISKMNELDWCKITINLQLELLKFYPDLD